MTSHLFIKEFTSYLIEPSYFYDHISRSIPYTVSNLFSCECEPSINYCKVEENKVLAYPMDCPKKFKEYCKCHNVEIEDKGPEFYRLYLRMDTIKFLIPIPESCLKQGTREKTLF